MCSTLGALPVDVIHSKLNIFLHGYGSYIPDVQTLQDHLDKLVKNGELVHDGLNYKSA